MSYRVWYFIAGLSGVAAALIGAYGLHKAGGGHSFDVAQTYHLVHTAALFGVAVMLAATEGKRNAFGCLLTNLGALAFVIGIASFAGGIYYQTIIPDAKAPFPMIPVGGASFATGWLLLALSSFGYRAKGE